MKKSVFCLVALCLSGLAVRAQERYTERLDSIVTNLEYGRPSKFVFRYDAEGRLVEMIEYDKQKGEWAAPLQSLYAYNEKGQVMTVTTKSLEDKRNVMPSRERAEYDAEGHLTSWVHELYWKEADKWQKTDLSGQRKYEYDARGNRTSIANYNAGLFSGKANEQWRSEMEYDKKGHLAVQRDYKFVKGEKQLRHTFRYFYDKRGNLVRTERYGAAQHNKGNGVDLIINRTYDKQGRVTSVSTRLDEELGSREEYSYDSYGNLIQMTTSYPHKGCWEVGKTVSFTYDQNTPTSSVMGLSCPEVLCNEYALKHRLNLTRKPLNVYVNGVNTHGRRAETTYYYSPVQEPSLPVSLSQMDSVQRNDYLVKLSREVVMNFGSGYYREYKRPEISELRVYSDSLGAAQHAELQRDLGRKYYRVTFPYDEAREMLEWNYAAQVEIWNDDGEPKGVLFGHGLGISFAFTPYRQWVREGIKDEQVMPYQSHIVKPRKIGRE